MTWMDNRAEAAMRMESPKDKLVKLWKQTCENTKKRLDNDFTFKAHRLPNGVSRFVRNYVNYKDVVARDCDVDINAISVRNKDNYLYFTYDSIPPLILEIIEIDFRGSIKLN